MRVREALRETGKKLKTAGIEESGTEAAEMVSFVLKTGRKELVRFYDREMTGEEEKKLSKMTERRSERYPLQYLVETWEFYGLTFMTRPGALIPRSDTECLVEHAVEEIKRRGLSTVLDLCAGSGCIGISVKKCCPSVTVTLADVSGECCALCEENSRLNAVDAEICRGDFFRALEPGRRFDCILTNPPYLTGDEMASLQPELAYEPAGALYGGADGLSFYRRLKSEYGPHLNPGGILLMEIGAVQGNSVRELFPGSTVWKDYSGNDRVVFVQDGTGE